MADYYTHAIVDAMKKRGWKLHLDRCGIGYHARFEVGKWPYPGSGSGVGVGRTQAEAIRNAALDALLRLDGMTTPEIVAYEKTLKKGGRG